MKDVALSSDGDGPGIFRATDKDAEHGSISGSYKTGRRKKGMTIPKNPEFLSRPLGDGCGNTAKVKLGGVGGGRLQL